MNQRTVAVLAFDDMEVLDYAGPYEVFNVAGELSEGSFKVVSVGVTDRPVGRGGFAVIPDFTLEEAPLTDVLVVPGGQGTRRLVHDPRLTAWLRTRSESADLVLSVCTGALLIASAGLLVNCHATTHHGAYDELASVSPRTTVQRGPRVVASTEHIRTSAGVSAGIDASLNVVEELAGPDLRLRVVEEMEWMWPDRLDEGAPTGGGMSYL